MMKRIAMVIMMILSFTNFNAYARRSGGRKSIMAREFEKLLSQPYNPITIDIEHKLRIRKIEQEKELIRKQIELHRLKTEWKRLQKNDEKQKK